MFENHSDDAFRFPSSQPPALPDPVVEEALARNIVTHKQVADAWLRRRTMYRAGRRAPVWRWLALQPKVDYEALLHLAAHCYDYKALNTDMGELRTFVNRIITCFSDSQWQMMLRGAMVPVKRTSHPGVSMMWKFAASDPTAKSTHMLVQQLVGKNYELVQADRKRIASLLGEVYLTRLELPRRPASGPAGQS